MQIKNLSFNKGVGRLTFSIQKEYFEFINLLSPLPIRHYPIPGNYDSFWILTSYRGQLDMDIQPQTILYINNIPHLNGKYNEITFGYTEQMIQRRKICLDMSGIIESDTIIFDSPFTFNKTQKYESKIEKGMTLEKYLTDGISRDFGGYTDIMLPDSIVINMLKYNDLIRNVLNGLGSDINESIILENLRLINDSNTGAKIFKRI